MKISDVSLGVFALGLIVLGFSALLRPERVQKALRRVLEPFEPYPLQGHIASPGYVSYLRIWGAAALVMGPVVIYSLFLRLH